MIDAGIESKACCSICIGGVAKDNCAPTDQHWNVGKRNSELIENCLNLGVLLDIEIAMRLTIAGKKLSQPQSIA